MTTKYYRDSHKFESNNDLPISVGNNWTQDSRREYSCPYCNRTLNRLTDRSGLSPSYYCNFCSIESNPENTDLRSKSSIEPQKGEEDNPLATTKFKEPTVGREPIELKGTFAALKAKGLKITNYKEDNG